MQLQRGIVRDDHPLQAAELAGRLEPVLLEQLQARLLVRAQRVALAAGAVEREHLQLAQPLARRVAADQRLDLAQDRVVPAERELGLQSLLERGDAEVVEARYLALRELFVREIRERRAVPERDRLTQRGGTSRRVECRRRLDGALEADDVDA